MMQDTEVTFATAEAMPNAAGPSATGAIGGTSVGGGAATPFFIDLDSGGPGSPSTTGLEAAMRDAIVSSQFQLAIDCDTEFTAGGIGGNAYCEFSLVSLPVSPLTLTSAATSGKLLARNGLTAATDNLFSGFANHRLPLGTPVYFSNLAGGVGLTAGTVYYVGGVDANRFALGTTINAALSGAPVVNITTAYTNADLNIIPYVHATTGFVPAAFMQPGARLLGRSVPYWAVGPQQMRPHFPAGEAIRVGGARLPTAALGGGAITGQKAVAAPGRYLCLMTRVLQASGGTGTFSARVVLNGENGQAHFPTRFESV